MNIHEKIFDFYIFSFLSSFQSRFYLIGYTDYTRIATSNNWWRQKLRHT